MTFHNPTKFNVSTIKFYFIFKSNGESQFNEGDIFIYISQGLFKLLKILINQYIISK